ncbi:MAG: hypothetical protein V4514_20630 [Pseudomonadota bacterium]|uniref:hypothetical protein n=1 Tax=Phenylobacterium sp. TaxID=1871053 RepID=UPI0025DF2BE8|nr:hypothetical protein [Phenylobacterium sp.]MBT9473747.1 hypothetical protein [Phenylobacterium sp.]
MKRRNLLDLLIDRPIVHPTRIDAVAWRGRQLTIAIRGHRWWASPYEDRQTEGKVSLVFNGLEEGRLLTDELNPDDDEALEGFEVIPVSDVPWAQGCDWSIYCSGPIGEPISLFAKVHDYLRLSEAFFGPEHFLNEATDISRFVAMTKAGGFLVGRGPACIRDLICAELERQGVPHNVVRTITDTGPKFLVRLGHSAFLCQEALAELAD